MAASASLIPELERVIRHGSRDKRAETVKRIANLFLDSASLFGEEHVALFDDVLTRLIVEIEAKARGELSRRLAPVDNAPPELMRRLAQDDDISIAGPVLGISQRLDESDLVAVALTKSQAHLRAIAGRRSLGEAVTEVLVQRGDREVARNVAGNAGARFSAGGFSTLVERAEQDGLLAEKVGMRPDIPPHLFRQLILQATEVVRRRLLASAREETRTEIQRVLTQVSDEMRGRVARDYAAAQQAVAELQRAGRLDEAALVAFAKAGQYEEGVAALAALCGVPIEVVDRLMTGDRPDPVLILSRAVGFGWPTAHAVIAMAAGEKGASEQMLDAAFANFEKLTPMTARRVMRFWQLSRSAR